MQDLFGQSGRKLTIAALALAGSAAIATPSLAHPHVFVEANLEVMRDDKGAITELRHVWRFDELFSATVLLDFDSNGNNELEAGELDAVSDVVTETIGEQGYFTQIRKAGKSVAFDGPERIFVEYVDSQVIMFFAIKPKTPVSAGDGDLRIAVSDPTYYVAMDLASEASIQITGGGDVCNAEIIRPDFDKLYAQNQATLTEQFFDNPGNASLGDAWLTWVEIGCR